MRVTCEQCGRGMDIPAERPASPGLAVRCAGCGAVTHAGLGDPDGGARPALRVPEGEPDWAGQGSGTLGAGAAVGIVRLADPALAEAAAAWMRSRGLLVVTAPDDATLRVLLRAPVRALAADRDAWEAAGRLAGMPGAARAGIFAIVAESSPGGGAEARAFLLGADCVLSSADAAKAGEILDVAFAASAAVAALLQAET